MRSPGPFRPTVCVVTLQGHPYDCMAAMRRFQIPLLGQLLSTTKEKALRRKPVFFLGHIPTRTRLCETPGVTTWGWVSVSQKAKPSGRQASLFGWLSGIKRKPPERTNSFLRVSLPNRGVRHTGLAFESHNSVWYGPKGMGLCGFAVGIVGGLTRKPRGKPQFEQRPRVSVRPDS